MICTISPMPPDLEAAASRVNNGDSVLIEYPQGEYTVRVWAWRGYGVVAPVIVTSNGSARMVAEVIVIEAVFGEQPVTYPPWLTDLLRGANAENYQTYVGTLSRLLARAYDLAFPRQLGWWMACERSAETCSCFYSNCA